MQNTLLFIIVLISPFVLATADSGDLVWEYPADAGKMDRLESPADLKVLWWNTACGNINAHLVKNYKQPESLYTNIETIAKKTNPPDLIILGEHCPGIIPKKTQALLKKIYPHNFNLEHSNPFGRIRNGIWIFSKWSLRKISQKNLAPDISDAENKITARTYLLFKVAHDQGDFYLSPVHFYNPWGKYSPLELPFAAVGTDNINYKQAEEHLKYLQEDLDLNKDPVLVIGDFNSAKNFYGVNMSGVNLFKGKLFDMGVNETTFPTPSAKMLGNGFPDVIIDQTFTSFNRGSTIMLPLKGSDHFPILFSF